MTSKQFTTITKRLINIEKKVNDLIISSKKAVTPSKIVDFKFIPIQEIFDKKICSKPTFYMHLKAGEYSLYKFGYKSFVDAEEFLNAFQKVNNNK